MSFGRSHSAAQVTSRFAVAAGLALACAAGGRAQPDKLDEEPPLPPQEIKRFNETKWRPKGGALAVPNPDRAIFRGRFDAKLKTVTGGIEDDRPLASEKQNADEAAAWVEVVVHAHGLATADLEKNAATDLTPDDLTQPQRRYFRLELVRFDGTLTKFRRVTPVKALADAGVTAVYEGWLVPVDESPANPVRVVFTELPTGFPVPPAPAAGAPAGDWLTTDRWVTFAGFFFKLATDPQAPVVVGKSVTPLPGPPAEAADLALATRYRVFRLVRDDAPVSRDPLHWEESAAWNRTLLHVRKFELDALQAAANQKLSFADLFQAGREDYQFKLVQIKGRLIRVKAVERSKRLVEAGVPNLYEAWVVPHDEPRGNPVCVVLTELPEGVAPANLMNLNVVVAGYFFKLFHYESAEPAGDDPTRHKWKKAPLILARGVSLVTTDPTDGPREWVKWFIPVIVGGVVTLALSAFLLSRWFRAGDERARAEFENARVKNPFTE
ncbi:MAG: hypothetical protein U0804_08800 [Gemmataceae bacterium]